MNINEVWRMMRFGLDVGLFTLILILLQSRVYIVGELIGGHYNVYPCTDNKAKTLLQCPVLETVSSHTTLECAISCSQNSRCKHALFNSHNKSCDHIEGLTNNLQPINKDNVQPNTTCILLSIFTDEAEWKRVEATDLMAMNNTSKFTPIKFVYKTSKYTTFHPVSHFTINSLGFFITPWVYIVNLPALKPKPYRTSNEVYYGDGTNVSLFKFSLVLKDGTLSTGSSSEDPDAFTMAKEIKLHSQVTVANTVDQLITALRQGYRRMERHPTRSVIDSIDTDVHFDMMDTFVIQSPDEIGPPFYFTSIKESFGRRKRYILKHQMLGVDIIPYEEETSKPPLHWVLDTSWTEGDSSFNDLKLKNAIAQGKDIRILIGENISTDVILVGLTNTDILLGLAPYIFPFEGSQSRDVNTNALRVRYPVVELSNSTLVECEMKFQDAGEVNTTSTDNSAPIKWFVSSRNWTRLFAMTSNLTVLFGSHEALNEAVFQGQDIRVCITKSQTVFYCFGAKNVQVRNSNKETLIQSPPFVDPFSAFSEGKIVCYPRTLVIVSTNGYMQYVDIAIGASKISKHVVTPEVITWFAD